MGKDGKEMREPIESGNTYLAFETGGGSFAIPICDTLGVVIGTQTMPSAVLPQMPDHVKCVITVDGQLITIITMPGEKKDVPLLGKPIVVLAHTERMIGVIANSVSLIVIPEEGISADRLTGTKTYATDSNIFSIVDIKRLFTSMEQS